MVYRPRRGLVSGLILLAAGLALTACGPVRTGAAAIVGQRRISVATLDTAVTRWGRELPRHPLAQQIVQQAQARGGGQGQQIPFDPSSPQRSALYQLVDMRVWSEVARRQHVAVASGQIDAFLAQNGGRPALDANVLAQGLPTSYGNDYARTLLVRQEMLRRYGSGGQVDQGGVQRLIGYYMGVGRSLGIRINPRYGAFDYGTMALGPICPRLSTPDSGTPAGARSEVKCQV
jgi:hypothetical protein